MPPCFHPWPELWNREGRGQGSPVLGIQPGSPAAASTAGDGQEEKQQRHKNARKEGGILTMRS